MEWFVSKANNKELNENLVGGSKETGEMQGKEEGKKKGRKAEGKRKRCINTWKFNGADEKKRQIIECCLCKRWYYIKCVTPEKGEPKGVKASNKKRTRPI